jgi:pimeloyl-ACP methyl ester carboxylesterase
MEIMKKTTNKIIGIQTSLQKSADTGIGILNGIIGDYLHNENSELAVQMQFYKNQRPIFLSEESFNQEYPNPSNKICISIHGLTNDESVWDFADKAGTNYGNKLETDFGYTPFYIRYNTGRHISENGKELSQLIDSLLRTYPVKVEEIIFIAHSMGGLIVRSACYYAPLQDYGWVRYLNKVIFLGTPHLGAPLEKFGNIVSNILKKIPVSYTNISGDIINLRSAGIKDLRYGYITDEDWKNHNPDALLQNHKMEIPLPKNVKYYLITGTVTKNPDHIVSQWFGDSLVRRKSATGQSHGKHKLAFEMRNHREFAGFSHHKLVNSSLVYEQISQWVSYGTTEQKLQKIRLSTGSSQSGNIVVGRNLIRKQISGVLNLVNSAILGGITQLEALNNDRITYKVLNHIPVIHHFSKEIEQIQCKLTGTLLSNSRKFFGHTGRILKVKKFI